MKQIICMILVVIFGAANLCFASESNELDEEYLKQAVLLETGNNRSLVNDVNILLDETDNNVVPYLIESNTVIPLRYLARILDVGIEWNGQTGEVKLSNEKETITFTLGESQFLYNGNLVGMPIPVTMKDDRNYVPLRSVAEATGYMVEYKDGAIILSKEKLNVRELEYAFSIISQNFDREEYRIIKNADGSRSFLRYSHGKSIMRDDDKFLLVDKNMEVTHIFSGYDRIIWENNNSMIWALESIIPNNKMPPLYAQYLFNSDGYRVDIEDFESTNAKNRINSSTNFMTGTAFIGNGEKSKIINIKGKIVSDKKRDINYFNDNNSCLNDYYGDGLYVVKEYSNNTSKYGYIDSKMEFIIEPKYFDARPFNEDLAFVNENERSQGFYIDKKGNKVQMKDVSSYTLGEPFVDGLSIVTSKISGKQGAIDKQGNLVIKCEFEVLSNFRNGFAIYTSKINNGITLENRKFGVIDKNGVRKTEQIYDDVLWASYDRIVALKDGILYEIDQNGRIIDSGIYQESCPSVGMKKYGESIILN